MPTIRKAQPADAGAIAAIYNDYVTNSTASFETRPVSTQEMRRRIAGVAARHPYYVCEEDGEILGFCYAHPWKERAAYLHTWETTVYIARSHCGKGIGRQLMETLIDACRNAGCHALVACITGGNTASTALHRRLGFRQASLFKGVGCKHGQRPGVVDYELLLAPQAPQKE